MLIHLDDDSLQLGAWRYLNNVWNKAFYVNGEDYSQSMAVDEDGAIRVDWTWPPSDVVRAYPEVMLGQSPWIGGASDTAQFPIRLDTLEDLSLSFDIDWSAPEASSFNLAFEFWLSSDPAAGQVAITNEVMIWVRSSGFTPAGEAVMPYADGIGVGKFYDRREHGDASGGTTQQWALTTLDYDADIHAGTVDVAALFRRLMDAGLVDEEVYLMNAEFGAEIVSGAGSYSIRALTINYADGTRGLLDPKRRD